MRRRTSIVCLLTAGLALAVLTAACGGSNAATGVEPPVATGNAVLQGSVRGASEGLRVVALGTSASASVDEDGQFLMSSLPPGSATLRFEGGGFDAKLSVDGLQNGLVTSITVTLSGATAQLNGPATCLPTSNTFFSGQLQQLSGTSLVVDGRTVDASAVQKVWRGERRIQLTDLQAGEKVKVWGTLRGDGVVLAEEIAALTNGSGSDAETWTTFTGRVEGVSSSANAGAEVHLACETLYPTLRVAGRLVHTSEKTKFHWSDGRVLDPAEIQVGQTATVEGWKKSDGSVRSTDLKLQP